MVQEDLGNIRSIFSSILLTIVITTYVRTWSISHLNQTTLSAVHSTRLIHASSAMVQRIWAKGGIISQYISVKKKKSLIQRVACEYSKCIIQRYLPQYVVHLLGVRPK